MILLMFFMLEFKFEWLYAFDREEILKILNVDFIEYLQIFWSKSELEMIQLSSVYQETTNQMSQIERDFLAIKPVRVL